MLSKTTHLAALGRATSARQLVPAVYLHGSSTIYRETVVDKAKNVVDSANKKVGKTLGDAIEGAQNAGETASHKAEELKRQATNTAESVKDTAYGVNKNLGKKVSEGIDAAEDAANTASKKANEASEKLKDGAHSEKTIIETLQDGVKTVESIYEKTKEAVGLKSKEAGHKYEEAKHEASSKAKEAGDHVQEKANKAAERAHKADDKATR